MTTDLDRSIRPNKWQKRGFQPEVVPPAPSPLVAINKLLAQIREETDPAEKQRLEIQFKDECDAFDAINPNSMPVDIGQIYREIVTTIAPIANQTAEIIPADFEMPETVSREQWLAIHRQIILCRRSVSNWLSKSRKFASDRWGIDFVTDAEVQMEMDLGIEQRDKPKSLSDGHREIAAVESFSQSFGKWLVKVGDGIDEWDRDKAVKVLAMVEPVAAFVEKLRVISARP